MRLRLWYRRNLKMSEGKLAAQSVHAALGLAQKFPEAVDAQHSVVVLMASDKKFEDQKEGKFYTHKDLGLTELPPDTETVLAQLID